MPAPSVVRLLVFTTSKIVLDDEIFPERRCHGHNSLNYSGPSIDWGATSLAVQFRLGILAKWRPGLDSFDCNHPRVDGTYLSEGQGSIDARSVAEFCHI